MSSEVAVYVLNTAVFVLAAIALGFVTLFVWRYIVRQCINKKFVNMINFIIILLLVSIIAFTIVIYKCMGDQ